MPTFLIDSFTKKDPLWILTSDLLDILNESKFSSSVLLSRMFRSVCEPSNWSIADLMISGESIIEFLCFLSDRDSLTLFKV